MVYYSMREYTLKGFEKSKRKGKKYSAILRKKATGRDVKVPFGALGYQHFKDSTPLKLYTKLNHGDKDRRRKYKQRHSGFIRKGYYSPGYFSMKYLW